MGAGIIIPVVVLAVVLPIGFTWAKRLKDGAARSSGDDVGPPGGRLTSAALRALPAPPWRVVYEIAPERLGGVEHVLLGPGGVFAIRTEMGALPGATAGPAEPRAVAAAAIARGPLDDVLARCATTSDLLVDVHWGPPADGAPGWRATVPGAVALDGRRIDDWVETLPSRLTPAQVDLAWRTVTTAIGRPDPLA
jgi:hypothetical protein